MAQRNRAEGWQHAKLSGHENERLVAELTQNDKSVQQRILQCAHLEGDEIMSVNYGGLCESDVDCILGGKTKSKTDMWLHLKSGKRINVSIKKDEGGQVFLIGIDRFIRGFEAQYHREIPNNIKRALSLYFGSAEDIPSIVANFPGANSAYEARKHRLVAYTLSLYNPTLHKDLLGWVNENIVELFDFCFAKGLAQNEEDWAQIVWYKNMIGENQFDTLIYILDIADKIPQTAVYGTRTGGSTIQLPFGFVQWHSPRKVIPGDIQFHHNYTKILEFVD